MKVLAGDIGGTKTLLQVAQVKGRAVTDLVERRYASADFADFDTLLEAFLEELPETRKELRGTCFAVAGPVTGRQARTTNLPWRLDADALSSVLGGGHVRLINDFQAVGYGIDGLLPDELLTLQEGAPQPGAVRAVLGAGTGLGEGILVWTGKQYEPLPTEGGHVDFAPTDELQTEMLRWLLTEHERVSYEHVLSGSGLINIYRFLQQRAGVATELPPGQDPAAAISDAALHGSDTYAAEALHVFCRIYGAQAGNLALTCLARGGVYVAGGIAPKIVDKLKDGCFMQAFNHKGRMSALTQTLPVHVVLTAQVGIRGAALAAARP